MKFRLYLGWSVIRENSDVEKYEKLGFTFISKTLGNSTFYITEDRENYSEINFNTLEDLMEFNAEYGPISINGDEIVIEIDQYYE